MTDAASSRAPRLSISRFSAATGLTPRTLRHYDAIGLLQPAWLDGRTGYRYYPPEQLGEVGRDDIQLVFDPAVVSSSLPAALDHPGPTDVPASRG